MNQRHLFVVLVAAALTAGFAAPASAAPTTATVTLTGGSLQITVPATAGNLGTHVNAVLAEKNHPQRTQADVAVPCRTRWN